MAIAWSINVTAGNFFFNFSMNEALLVLLEHSSRDRNFKSSTETVIIVCYALLMTTGLVCNVFMIIFISTRPRVRISRNLLLINLNISDLALCIFSMPFTLLELVYRDWYLGLALCKSVSFVQGWGVFVSTITISVIAFDRYRTIVRLSHSTHRDSGKNRIARYTVATWLISLIFAAPSLVTRTIRQVDIGGFVMYSKCVENWNSMNAKAAYTVVVTVSQFLLPTAVLLTTQMKIKGHLSNFRVRKRHTTEQIHKEILRNRRVTFLLMKITFVFALSWLPWNIWNLMIDLQPFVVSPSSLYLAFAVCHLLAMTSATSNPILYGWLNTAIRRELMRLGKGYACLSRQKSVSAMRSRPSRLNKNAFHAADQATTVL